MPNSNEIHRVQKLGNEFLSTKHDIRPGVLDDILRICLIMLDEGEGALITVGDARAQQTGYHHLGNIYLKLRFVKPRRIDPVVRARGFSP